MTEFDQYHDGYNERINQAIAFSGQTREFYTEVKARCLLDFLSRLQPQVHVSKAAQEVANPLKVLDVGCGQGLIHRFLRPADANVHITGIDVAATVIEEARRDNPHVQYDVYDGERLPYAAQTFDAAFAIAVMHHVPPESWEQFLCEMCRVVRPGGLVVVIEHNPINPLTQWIVRTCPFDENAVLLGPSRLAQLFQRVGLVEPERRYILFTPFGGAFFRRLDGALRKLPFGAQYCMVARVSITGTPTEFTHQKVH